MNWFYLGCCGCFAIVGFLLVIYPIVGQRIVKLIIKKELQILPGTIEIALGLGSLYFRDVTKMKWFVYIMGLLLFIDGIMYLISARRFKELSEVLLSLGEKAWRSYGYIALIIAIGYMLAAIR